MASDSIKYSVVIQDSILFILVESTYNSLLIFTILFCDAYNHVYATHFTLGDPTGAPVFYVF